jgi:hypothetical protein
MEKAARDAFARLGQTSFELHAFHLRNEGGWFVPVSRLNQLRRELAKGLQEAMERESAARLKTIAAEMSTPHETCARAPNASGFCWLLKVDRIGFLDGLEDRDVEGVGEIVVDISRDHPSVLVEKLDYWAGRMGRNRLRLALPPLTRFWEEKGLRHKIARLRADGWKRWEAANLSAWSYLDLDPQSSTTGDIDLATDWSIYVLNRLAAAMLVERGISRFTLSPEDGLTNMRPLLSEFAGRAVVIVYQDTPQFLAESCAYANLIGGCPGKANCKFESMQMVSSHGEKVLALDYHCRTIVLNQGPFCLSSHLSELARAGAVHLRADFIYRPYEPLEVRNLWRLVRAGRPIPQGHAANFARGIL